jgi:hypothetical protein
MMDHVPARAFALCSCKLARVFDLTWPTTLHLKRAPTMLPDELIAQLDGEFVCREQQIRHLAALYAVRRRYTQHSPYSG